MPYNFGVHKWKLTVPVLVVHRLKALVRPRPIIKHWGKSHTKFLHFFFIPSSQLSSTSIGPMFSLDVLLLLTYFKRPFLLADHSIRVPTLIKLQLFVSPSCIYEPELCNFLAKLDLTFTGHIVFFSSWAPRGVSLFSQGGLLPLLLHLYCNGIAFSCASERQTCPHRLLSSQKQVSG